MHADGTSCRREPRKTLLLNKGVSPSGIDFRCSFCVHLQVGQVKALRWVARENAGLENRG